jgi:hypothetical protein
MALVTEVEDTRAQPWTVRIPLVRPRGPRACPAVVALGVLFARFWENRLRSIRALLAMIRVYVGLVRSLWARFARAAWSHFGLLPTTKWIARSGRMLRGPDGDGWRSSPSVVQGAAAV